jgi:hypothetical protein
MMSFGAADASGALRARARARNHDNAITPLPMGGGHTRVPAPNGWHAYPGDVCKCENERHENLANGGTGNHSWEKNGR